jgi:hypothetical protein
MTDIAGYEKLPGRNSANARAALDKAKENGFAEESVLSVRDGYLIPLTQEQVDQTAADAAEAAEAEEFDVDSAKVPELDKYIADNKLDVDTSLNKPEKIAAIKAALEQKE